MTARGISMILKCNMKLKHAVLFKYITSSQHHWLEAICYTAFTWISLTLNANESRGMRENYYLKWEVQMFENRISPTVGKYCISCLESLVCV